jgi:hypothetical protein
MSEQRYGVVGDGWDFASTLNYGCTLPYSCPWILEIGGSRGLTDTLDLERDRETRVLAWG